MTLSTRWWHGILARSLMAVIAIAILMGTASSFFAARIAAERVQHMAMQKLDELLDTVESTVSVACFANDDQLAKEVVQGLLRNSEVRRIVINSGDHDLATAARSGSHEIENTNLVTRKIHSPFNKKEVIGSIQLEVDQQVIDARVAENVRLSGVILMSMLLLVIGATATTLFYLVVRPIKQTSDHMHHLKVTSGEQLDIPDGHERTEIGRLVGDINHLTGRLVSVLDQERHLRKQQEIDQRKYHDLFDHSNAGIFVASREGTLTSFNPAFAELTWLPHVKKGTPVSRSLDEPQWHNSEELLTMLRQSLDEGGRAQENDFQLDGRRGDTRWLRVAMIPLGDGSVQGTVTDVTAIKKDELSARRLAVTDSLTNFANREGLTQAYAHLNENTQPFMLVRIDFDGIRQVTEAKGFSMGDRVLVSVANRLRSHMKEGDFIARISGTKFAWMLAGECDRDAAKRHINDVAEQLSLPYVGLDETRDVPVMLGVRIGVSCFPEDGKELQPLLRRAELALSNVVAETHSCVFFESAHEAVAEHRRRMEDDLRAAVTARELELYCQPIVDIQKGRVVGGEALLRWTHQQHGSVPPDVFVPMAERVGLIGDLGNWVMQEASQHIARWRNEGLDLYMSVNVSVRQIPEEMTIDMVIAMLTHYGLRPDALAIEITESVLMSNVTIAQQWISRLREVGVRIYMDDFGTGYSSLSYLKRFSLDTVKIDGSFIRDMQTDNSDHALVNAIITMARSLGLGVVAEGIEDEHQLRLLREAGCGYGQGYYFSRPVPMAQFVPTITRINDELSKSLSA